MNKSNWLSGAELAEEAINCESLEFAEKHLSIMNEKGSNSEEFVSGFKACIENYKYFQDVNRDHT